MFYLYFYIGTLGFLAYIEGTTVFHDDVLYRVVSKASAGIIFKIYIIILVKLITDYLI